MLTNKMKSLVNCCCDTFTNNNPKSIQNNARQAMEAFCKIIILHHHGEKRGEAIIYSKDIQSNKKLNLSDNQKKKAYEVNLSMLIKMVADNSILNRCYQPLYKGEALSSKIRATQENLKRHLNILVFKGNSSSHESSPIEMGVSDVYIAQHTLKMLLSWLFEDFLKCPIPSKLIKYIEKYDIFLSYRQTNEEWINLLYENLNNQGYKVFLDKYEVRGGDNISEILESAIERSSSAIVVYPKDDHSKWLKKEMNWINKREKKDSSFKMTPIMLKESKSFNKDIAYVDFRNKTYEEAFNDLVSSLHVTPSRKSISTELKIPDSIQYNSSQKKDKRKLKKIILWYCGVIFFLISSFLFKLNTTPNFDDINKTFIFNRVFSLFSSVTITNGEVQEDKNE